MNSKQAFDSKKAFVVQSADPTWPMWACVKPTGDTKWYDTEEKAKNCARQYNDYAARGVIHGKNA